MPPISLEPRQYVVAIIRAVLDGRARIVYGELLDADARPIARFRNRRGLAAAVRTWLVSQAPRPREPGA